VPSAKPLRDSSLNRWRRRGSGSRQLRARRSSVTIRCTLPRAIAGPIPAGAVHSGAYLPAPTSGFLCIPRSQRSLHAARVNASDPFKRYWSRTHESDLERRRWKVFQNARRSYSRGHLSKQALSDTDSASTTGANTSDSKSTWRPGEHRPRRNLPDRQTSVRIVHSSFSLSCRLLDTPISSNPARASRGAGLCQGSQV